MGGTRFRKVWPKKCGPPAVSMSEKFPSPQICVKKKNRFLHFIDLDVFALKIGRNEPTEDKLFAQSLRVL